MHSAGAPVQAARAERITFFAAVKVLYCFGEYQSIKKGFGKHSVNAVAGTSTMARKYTWNSVGVEGKSTTYKVEDGQLVIGEQPGGFPDPG